VGDAGSLYLAGATILLPAGGIGIARFDAVSVPQPLTKLKKGENAMELLKSNVGRKILMAITGQFMVLFVIVHLLGNSSIFLGEGAINAYAKHLHDLGPFVWIFRLGMLALVLVHAILGILVSIENSDAKPIDYKKKRRLRANISSETMIWTGLLIAAFVTYHLFHFTGRVMPDTASAVGVVDSLGRFDVFKMVTNSFSLPPIALIYVAAMIVLFLHLKHGIQSFFQTMGWNNENSLPKFSAVGRTLAVVFLLGYSAIPLVILAGYLNK
jgi:succinate dehydrogenase / fumarate reductase cytochrome b subunit